MHPRLSGSYTTTLKSVSGGFTATAKLTSIVSAPPPNGGTAPIDTRAVTAGANNTSVIVNWTAVTTATRYKLDRKVAGGSYSELVSLPTTQTSYTDSALTPGTSYVYRVRTMMAQGTSTGHESPTVTFSGPPASDNQYPVTPPTSSHHAFQGTLTATTASGVGDLDCRDFTSQSELQIYFNSKGSGLTDNVDMLDWNHNVIPYEINEEGAIRSKRWAIPTTPTPPVVTPAPPATICAGCIGYYRRHSTWVSPALLTNVATRVSARARASSPAAALALACSGVGRRSQ